MTTRDAPPATRRSLRRDAAAASTASAPAVPTSRTTDDEVAEVSELTELEARFSDRPHGDGIALAWLDDDQVTARSSRHDLAATTGPYALAHADLLAHRPRRSPLRASALVPPLCVATVVAGAYAASTLLWPLHAVEPVIEPVVVTAPVAAPATPAWPSTGAAATAVDGLGTTAATTGDAASIASITKLVTALMVLEQQPLAVGEAGREYAFDAADRRDYRAYRDDGQSSLDVPVSGVLTQYQMLQGVLIGSANNYADRLVSELWPNDTVYARAANTWLEQHGLAGITVVDPSGIDPDNAADPASIVALGKVALANPVIAEIVRTPSVDLPGAGLVENTNSLLATDGVIGLKTGTLFDSFNLLAAQDASVGDQTVRAYAAVTGQPDDETRDAATAALLAQTLAEVAASPALASGTLAGTVTTPWGATSEVRTTADVRVALWNGQVSDSSSVFELGDAREAGDSVGELTLSGPLGSVVSGLELVSDVEDPDAWWRLTHPLELWGLID